MSDQYPHDWILALANEVENGKSVLGKSDVSWRELNDACTAIEMTRAAMVESPEAWSDSGVLGLDNTLPPYEDVVTDTKRYVGERFCFVGNYVGEKQYEKGKSYDCVLTVGYDGSDYARVEHYPLKVSHSFDRTRDNVIVKGWLVGVDDGDPCFVADTVAVIED